MNLDTVQKKRFGFLFIVLIPIFILTSVSASGFFDARKRDFAAYWQAGHMILSGQDIYDSSEWIAQRELMGTAPHSEPAFHYPLPFAILFSPLALLPVQSAYTAWLFFEQVAMLTAVFLLWGFYPARSGYIELLTIAGVFLFRPSFSVLFNGQILALLLLLVSISILLFHRQRWFWGGLSLSMLALKPSIGIPILALAGVWLLFRKQWKGVAGIAAGGAALFLIGVLVNPRWVVEYLQIGSESFDKYFGLHPTLWGAVDKIFVQDDVSLIAGSAVVLLVFGIETYLLGKNGFNNQPLDAFASILPAGLLIAPYSWSYDQILLAPALIYVMIRLSSLRGNGMSALFLFGVVILSISLVWVAYLVLHDVWSFLNAFVVWVFALSLVTRDARLERT